jgi:NADPH-dependent 2,4-dienoyl-CoA reductase/sulfur reductase-like enzyme/nitrite reductase/ring-hydroxylating ferredoxin subunit
MMQVDLAGKPVLLARVGDEIHAIDGTCPHAGGPLAEGTLDGDQIICPWHKAVFCLRSGRCDEPPAVDDLDRYRAEIRDGEILLWPKPIEPPARHDAAPEDTRRFVIIGGGAAGSAAAQTLRAEGFTGEIVMIDAEAALPYDRTILSKYALSGEKGGEKSPLHGSAFYRRNRITRKHGAVTELTASARSLLLTDGTRYDYDAALVSTGGIPNEGRFEGAKLGNVFTLRSQDDAKHIAAAAAKSARAVVVGTGFIGLEAASSLRQRGLAVTVVGPEKLPLERQLGAKIGRVFRKFHEANGVHFRLGSEVLRLEGSDAVERVVLTDGGSLKADLVVLGLGIHPATGFIRGLSLDEDGGVTVDATLRAARSLYAAGDIAAFPLRGGGPRIRVEHWRVAQQHGRRAALNMLGFNQPFESVPLFWTIHFGEPLFYIGHAGKDDSVLVRGQPAKRSFIAYFHHNCRVTAVAGMGRDTDMSALLALLERPRDWTVDELHPPRSTPTRVLAALARG